MVGSNGTMIAIRLVRSKLRKREDHGNDDVNVEQPSVVHSTKDDCKLPPTPPVSPTSPPTLQLTTTTTTTTVTQQTVNDIRNNGIVNAGATINTTEFTNGNIDETNHFVNDNADQYVWQFPPPYPPSTPPPQYTLYNDQVLLFLFYLFIVFKLLFENIYIFSFMITIYCHWFIQSFIIQLFI